MTAASAGPAPCRAPPPGRLVLAGAPLGRATDASTGLARALASAPLIAAEDTRRLHRLAADLGVSDLRPGAVVLRGQRAGPGPAADQRPAGRPGRPGGDRRRHAVGVRSRLPAGGGRDRGRPAGDRAARAVGGHHRDRGVGAAGGPVLLRGLPAAQGRQPAAVAGRARRRAPDHGVLRVPAPDRGVAGRPGRGAGRRPAGRGVPGADQDLRGGDPGLAGRAGRVGGRRGPGRDHPGGRRPAGRRRAARRRLRSPSWSAPGSGPARAARRRSPRWP